MNKTLEIISPEQEIYRRLSLAMNYIDCNFSGQIDLNAISSQAFFSRYHFLRIFKQRFNITPHRYLTYKRMEKAKYLLGHTDMTLLDVSFEVGFSSVGSFGSLFTKYTGKSPGAYRSAVNSRKIFAVKKPGIMIPSCYIKRFIAR